jgi:hypothetical protein
MGEEDVCRTAIEPNGVLRTPMIEKQNGIREIKITQLDYGYIVIVGCNSFAIETADKLIKKLTQYIKQPQEIEQKWLDTKTLS